MLHRAAHHTQRTRNGGEYGNHDFEDFFPVDSHSCNLLFDNLLFTIYLQFDYLIIGLPDGRPLTVNPATQAFPPRTSAIQASLIALGLASVDY